MADTIPQTMPIPSSGAGDRIEGTDDNDDAVAEPFASSHQHKSPLFEILDNSRDEADTAVHVSEALEESQVNTTVCVRNSTLAPCAQLSQVHTETAHRWSSDLANLEIEDKASLVLDSLPEGARVALVTMVGSLCPVTLGHVESFVEARKILIGFDGVPRPVRLEHFDACIGIFRLNSDGHVRMKMQQKGDHFLKATERGHLVKLATRSYNWLGLSFQARGQETMIRRYPRLQFVKFSLNGADDVAKYAKWGQASRTHRFITMGRPGDTQKVVAGMRRAKINPDDGFFVLGPELADVSSTKLRRLLRCGQSSSEQLDHLVDVAVGEWCIQKWRKEGWSDIKKERASR